MKVIFSAIAIAFLTSRASATNYYLSSKGNDSLSGTSAQTPWRCLKKLLTVTESLQPGDSIFLERGSVFRGEIKISVSGKQGREIYIGAYGSGPRPIVSGSTEVKNWTLFRGNIWVADCTECLTEPSNLFIDGRYQPLGRYPNSSYLTLSCASQCKTSLSDNHLTFADGYWDGAEVVVKSSRWTLDKLPVVNYFNKVFFFGAEASYSLPNGYGYFIQKHLATLDTQGEWYFDKASKRIFIYCKSGDKPTDHKVEISITGTGLTLENSNFITIENITFNYQQASGVQIKYCGNISLRNCAVNYPGSSGIEIVSCQSPIVKNCIIKNSNNNGVEWIDNVGGSFIRNFIQATGLHPGRGGSGNGTYIGLSITASKSIIGKNIFQFNTVDSTGYIGVDFRTGGTTIKNNLISNFCMIKDDGAGIYTWGNSSGDNSIEGNIVAHGIGCGAGTTDNDQLWAHGIYIDDRSSDINVFDNTVAYCAASGIYVHNAKRVSLRGNKLFENANTVMSKDKGQLCIKLDGLVVMENKELDLRVTDNLFATMREGNQCIYLTAEKEQDLSALGLFDENKYIAPQANQTIAKFYGHQDVCDAKEEMTLSDWQRCTDRDKNSQFKMVAAVEKESTGLNMIKNGLMTYNTQGWMSWPQQVFIVHDKKNGANRPSLRVQFPSGKNEALLYYPSISLSSSKWYRLSFSAKSAKKSKIEFTPLMATAPWEALGEYACFSIDTVFKSFSYLFKPNKSFNNARVNFKSSDTFWIDDVTLTEIHADAQKIEGPIQIIYNASEKLKTIPHQDKSTDLEDNPLPNPLILSPYGSIILKRH